MMQPDSRENKSVSTDELSESEAHTLTDLIHAAQGCGNSWSLAFYHIKLNAQCRQGREDVTKEDDAVSLEGTPRLY